MLEKTLEAASLKDNWMVRIGRYFSFSVGSKRIQCAHEQPSLGKAPRGKQEGPRAELSVRAGLVKRGPRLLSLLM